MARPSGEPPTAAALTYQGPATAGAPSAAARNGHG
jgi:hypothetical protein